MNWVGYFVSFVIGAFGGMVFMALYSGKQIANLKIWNRRLQDQRDSWKAEAQSLKRKLKE